MFLISSHGEGWEAAFEGFQRSILAPWGAALHASSLCSRRLCQRGPLRVRAVHPADGEGLSCHGGLLEGRAPTLGAAEQAVLAADGPMESCRIWVTKKRVSPRKGGWGSVPGPLGTPAALLPALVSELQEAGSSSPAGTGSLQMQRETNALLPRCSCPLRPRAGGASPRVNGEPCSWGMIKP